MRWSSFELEPQGSKSPGVDAASVITAHQPTEDLGRRRIETIRSLGADVGLELNLDRAHPVNTFDAHRVLQYAATNGKADLALESLLHGYHTAGRDIADPSVLIELSTNAGLDADEVEDVLQSERFVEDVRADEALAHRRGIHGVPALVIDDRRPVNLVESPEVLSDLLSPG